MTNDRRTITVPASLCDLAAEKFGPHFGSVENLIEMVLRELLQDEALKMDEREQRLIEERLKALGYV